MGPTLHQFRDDIRVKVYYKDRFQNQDSAVDRLVGLLVEEAAPRDLVESKLSTAECPAVPEL